VQVIDWKDSDSSRKWP